MNKRVLLIEDNPLDQLLAATILRKSGYVVDCESDGLVAIERVASGELFDIVLVDYELPTLNGIEITIELRSLDFRKPIIAVSAGPESELISTWRKAGCCEFLAKPYSPKLLREFVDQAVSRRMMKGPLTTRLDESRKRTQSPQGQTGRL